jgi:hypothetical protein
MVTLYTWFPSTPAEQIEFVLPPDLGHSALQVIGDSGLEAYVSFWPDPKTLAGAFAHRFAVPPSRFPLSYLEEIDPKGHFMRRPSAVSDCIEGLDETLIVRGWQFLRESHFDIRYWNCSDVTKLLILHAMDERYFVHLQDAARLTTADLSTISSVQEVRGIVRYLATRNFIDSRPDDVVHLVRVYNRTRETMTT